MINRDDLIDRVRRGEIAPEQAEAEADRLGLAPLTGPASPAAYDPKDQPTWSLVMAVAWIVWRTPDAVRDHWNKYRLRCRWWRPLDDGSGYELVQKTPASLMCLSIEEAIDDTEGTWDQSQHVSVKTAREDLWRKLQEDSFTATAIDARTGDVVDIPAREWPRLAHMSLADLADALRFDGVGFSPHDRLAAAYLDIGLKRTDVVSGWPERGSADDPSPPKSTPKLTVARQAIEALWPDGDLSAEIAETRHRKISDWCKDNKFSPPSDRTIRRAIQLLSKRSAAAD